MNQDLNSIGKDIIGASFEVRRILGRWLLEKVYEKALAYELTKMNHTVLCQHPIPVAYKGMEIIDEGFRLDLFVDDKVIVELKAKSKIIEEDCRQLMTYLKLQNRRLGYLINLGAQDFRVVGRFANQSFDKGIYRIVNGI